MTRTVGLGCHSLAGWHGHHDGHGGVTAPLRQPCPLALSGRQAAQPATGSLLPVLALPVLGHCCPGQSVRWQAEVVGLPVPVPRAVLWLAMGSDSDSRRSAEMGIKVLRAMCSELDPASRTGTTRKPPVTTNCDKQRRHRMAKVKGTTVAHRHGCMTD